MITSKVSFHDKIFSSVPRKPAIYGAFSRIFRDKFCDKIFVKTSKTASNRRFRIKYHQDGKSPKTVYFTRFSGFYLILFN